MHDPVNSPEMVGAAEEATRPVVTALSSPWSLYTPQDAATAAVGLFVQLDTKQRPCRSSGARPDGSPSAVRRPWRHSSRCPSRFGPWSSITRPAPCALDAAPPSPPIPADVHATAVAVAEQHTDFVTPNRCHKVGAFEDPEDGFGYGITLHTAEEEYTFYRGNWAWSLAKDSDGRDLGDGSTVCDAHETLSVCL
ncbi:hypothetical protein GCM10023082_50030 [Streptomyces tremellae]|uniref:Uncharacterized protein n=1 Tax=Streptomyces tremellae TaxID=1124239 RepID=A0ABP7FU12_9ACTN